MAPSPSSSATTSVQVALRIRPPTQQDSISIPARFQRTVIHAASSTSVNVEAVSTAVPGAPVGASSGASAKKQVFNFDQVHGQSTTQHHLFTTTAQPLISRFVEGFNCTILAYGQTSSGKTFTMTGIDLDADPSDPNNGMGIIPRAVSTIFTKARKLKEERGGAWNYSIKGSFIEIYNEDLIDLLSMDDAFGGKREVQIREDKDGHIIWGGLREVNVKNANEVMSLIRKGTAIRRTNETDMNAQSSRSHAIFSLTLTQKKYTGSGAPPRSSSPLPPNGRSPSRLARPGSVYSGSTSTGPTRVSSPTFGRPQTPSFVSAMGRGGGLRPSSALGHSSDRTLTTGDEDAGEWVTIVSKFHFVDLAGSERIKKTAAAGERIKEGISINSGLLALGNVISALGDPSRAKTHTATHIPYRDSKLTRLLQDSLGGNAHTLMIACVSPAEYNAAETINTLKYANRARNIKNRAVVNEKEDGWDDIEWLQGTVTRLRKELKAIKEGGPIPASSESHGSAPEGASKKVLAQMTELQNNYEDLREKFVERTEELTRLRRELGESHRGSASSGTVTGTAKYEEIVGPVIEEYEKTIATMEAELSLNRAALRHTNEMYEEKEDEFAEITERHAATELYVEELRSRVAKLTEREASTEAYVRDLEEKMKSYDESSISSSESMTDLKREVAKFKDSEAHSSKYIVDLEARLARADESILALQQTVERLEKECEKRRAAAETLQARLDALRQDGENWRVDLEERENRVRELEERMEEWERKRQEAGETRVRLGNVVNEVAIARRSLEADLGANVNGDGFESPASPATETPALVANGDEDTSASPKDVPLPAEEPDQTLRNQFIALQETHTATLADLSSVTSKYRDALREISDLAAQIQEAKLSGQSLPERSESPVTERSVERPPIKRRMTSGKLRETSEAQYNSAGRRLFFRQAASTESLRSRSLSQSQSLSQELSSAHSRKTSFSSHGTGSSHSPSNSHSTSTLNNVMGSRPALSISVPNGAVQPSERSVVSLEKEIMRLQEVLKERESEIAVLEASLRENNASKEPEVNVPSPQDNEAPITSGNGGDTSLTAHLSPKTINQFDHIRKSMELNGNGHAPHDSVDGGSERNGSSVISETDESLERLNELMLSMAQKEASHREEVDQLTSQLTQTRRQLDDLTTLSRDQTANMSAEFESLRNKYADDLQNLEDAQKHETELLESLKKLELDHASEVESLRTQHEEALKAKEAEVDAMLTRLKEENDGSISKLRDELAAGSAALEQARREHEAVFGKLKAEHEAELARRAKEVESILGNTQEEHDRAMAKVVAEHAEVLKVKEVEASAALQQTEEDYYNVLTKLRSDHAEALERQAAEAAATLERLKEEHAAELRMAEIASQGSLSASESTSAAALQSLRDEHSAAMSRKDTSFAEELEKIKGEHARALETREADHTIELDKLRSEHNGVLAKLKEEWRVESERLISARDALEQETSAAAQKAKKELEAALHDLKVQQATVIEELTRGHEGEMDKLKSSHDEAVKALSTKADEERETLVRLHTEESAKLKSVHEQAVAELNTNIVALQADHASALEELRNRHGKSLTEERERLAATLEDLKSQHSQERETLRKDYELLSQELEAHKAAADEFTLLREQTRESHEQAIQEKTDNIKEMQTQLSSFEGERDELAIEVARLRSELNKKETEQSKLVQEASKRESLVMELERHRSVLADLQENLQKVKDEKDTLQTEKTRADTLVRELQAQIARSGSPPNPRPTPERNISAFNRPTPTKLPPPTPPPNVPPPPAPRSAHVNGDAGHSISSQTSTILTSSSSSTNKESQPDSPSTSVGHMPSAAPAVVDTKATLRLEQQSKQIEEQEAMIKTLNKQLTHCESDLQNHMDLVSTLETSLGDAEKNLRKARMHATEIARERDTLSTKVQSLQNELAEAKRDAANARKSIMEEKQSYELRLDEERRAKERARQQLDSRTDELTRRKSKFACL